MITVKQLVILGISFFPIIGMSATVDYQNELKQYKQTINKEQKDLKAIQRQLDHHRKIARSKKRKEGSVLKQIHKVERQIDDARQNYQSHQKNLVLVNSKITYLNQIIEKNQSEIKELKLTLAKRIRLIYREKSNGFWQILATSGNLGEALLRMKFFYTMASQNAFLLSQLNQKEATLIKQQAELFNRKSKAEDLKQVTIKTLVQVKQHRKNRQKILKRIQQERQLHEKASKELAVASRKLSQLIRQLKKNAAKIRKKMKQSGDLFARLKGLLSWPTRGRVVKRFGKIKHPRFNTYIHNKGIDIAGTMGQNISSVAKGYVLFAQWFEGYGRMIILDHGRGYNTVYAHLSEIQVTAGEAVKSGQTIGKLGDSGTWKGPALYFEIRKQGRAVNPIRWLER